MSKVIVRWAVSSIWSQVIHHSARNGQMNEWMTITLRDESRHLRPPTDAQTAPPFSPNKVAKANSLNEFRRKLTRCLPRAVGRNLVRNQKPQIVFRGVSCSLTTTSELGQSMRFSAFQKCTHDSVQGRGSTGGICVSFKARRSVESIRLYAS